MTARMLRRRTALLAVLLPLLLGVSACSEETQGIREVQSAIAATRLEPHRFVYTVSTPEEGAFQVQGLVEDDFRYKARLLRGDDPLFDEVVNDDAIAVRFAEPQVIGAFVDDSQKEVADLETNLSGVSVIEALQARRWVVDPFGAPALTDASRAVRNRGEDHVFDALGLFAYVEQAMRESLEVHRWSEDDLNPAYRASEDVFPRPADDSGVRRYDLRRPPLPPVGAQAGAAADAIPATKHFRKMAIYVEDGRIIRVMERVEVTGKAGDDFVDHIREFLDEIGLEDQIDEFEEELEGLNDKERSDFLLAVLSQALAASGGDPITVRTMTFDVRDVGEESIVAALPDDVIEGSLAILRNRGNKEEAATASGSPQSPAASPTAPGAGG